MKEVEKWYDEKYDEWSRLEHHPVEFDITMRFLKEAFKGEGLNLLDIGGGPGRYAIELKKMGHRVTLVDLSKRNIQLAEEKAKLELVTYEGLYQGNALDLSDLNLLKGSFDGILLMGPLYHLLEERERKQAIEEALTYLKTGGILVAAFISAYAPIQDHLKGLHPIESVQKLLRYLKDGRNTPEEGFTTAYFITPKEAIGLMEEFPLRKQIFASVENVLASKEQELKNLSGKDYENYLDICFQLSQDPYVFGAGEHFLYIGEKISHPHFDMPSKSLDRSWDSKSE